MDKDREYELMKRFLEENTDILLKYMIWTDNFLEPQVFTNEVEAEDIDYGELD